MSKKKNRIKLLLRIISTFSNKFYNDKVIMYIVYLNHTINTMRS